MARRTSPDGRSLEEQLQARWDKVVAGLPPLGNDPGLEIVRTFFQAYDPYGEKMAAALRESLDHVYDGPRTGRFSYAELLKTEKTHVGTIVEINVGRAFDLDARPEDATDYRIDGVLVDCKYSMAWGGWEIPVEAWGHVVLLTWASDEKAVWSAGLWRVDPTKLGAGKNRDLKRKLLSRNFGEITMLWDNATLPENTLLLQSADVLAEICDERKSGQKRINALFRLVPERIIRREVVLTVARQRDGLRRARMAREPRNLGREGILVLGHYEWDVAIAESLGLPVPRSGEWISVRVAPAHDGAADRTFEADGQRWRRARPDDPVVAAPRVPRSRAIDADADV